MNNPNNSKHSIELYGNIPNGHSFELPRIEIGEIIDENLNSRGAIKVVLKNLSDRAGLGSEEGWIQIGFDCVPYRIRANIRADIRANFVKF